MKNRFPMPKKNARMDIKQKEDEMADKGKKDKGKREEQKKSQQTKKEKRKHKKDKKQSIWRDVK